VKLFKGHIAELLRHPAGADVLVDLYDVAPQPLRNAMCAELYGREYVLFDGVQQKGSEVQRLKQLYDASNAAKQKSILESLTKGLSPVVEKVGG
jgi:pumilio family protein 6